jgi:hypothetical protein
MKLFDLLIKFKLPEQMIEEFPVTDVHVGKHQTDVYVHSFSLWTEIEKLNFNFISNQYSRSRLRGSLWEN